MKKMFKATAVSIAMAAAIGAFAPNAHAAPISWVLSPDADAVAFGVTVVPGFNEINFANSASQPAGIFGAGFKVATADYNGGFSMKFDADLYSWDSYNATNGYYDAFVVTISTADYYWNLPHTDPIPTGASTWVWGGDNWADNNLSNYTTAPTGPLDMVSLSPVSGSYYYVSVVLDTSTTPDTDTQHPSWGSFHVSPIPEPETYAMMLAGLGLLGFAARRRKQKAA